MRNYYKNFSRKKKFKRPLGSVGVGRRIILKWTSKELGVRVWSLLSGVRVAFSNGSL
jgi:hypothetical protein